MKIFVLLAALFLPLPALANDMIDACRRAMELYYEPRLAPEIKRVQEFPGLEPPRVVVFHQSRRFGWKFLPKSDRAQAKTRCEFQSNAKPVQLTDMTIEGENAYWFSTRFEEIQVILEREGF